MKLYGIVFSQSTSSKELGVGLEASGSQKYRILDGGARGRSLCANVPIRLLFVTGRRIGGRKENHYEIPRP